jgi:anaerobic ribonucleoside-triphosphate reductase
MSMGHFNWNEILGARFDGNRVRATSMHQAMYDLMKSKSQEFESNRYLVSKFDEIFKSVAARYQATDSSSLKPKEP